MILENQSYTDTYLEELSIKNKLELLDYGIYSIGKHFKIVTSDTKSYSFVLVAIIPHKGGIYRCIFIN